MFVFPVRTVRCRHKVEWQWRHLNYIVCQKNYRSLLCVLSIDVNAQRPNVFCCGEFETKVFVLRVLFFTGNVSWVEVLRYGHWSWCTAKLAQRRLLCVTLVYVPAELVSIRRHGHISLKAYHISLFTDCWQLPYTLSVTS